MRPRGLERIISFSGKASSRLLIAALAAKLIGDFAGLDKASAFSLLLLASGLVLGLVWICGTIITLRQRRNLCLLEAYLSILLWQLTPWGLYNATKQLVSEAYFHLKGINPLPSEEDPIVMLPVRGCWLVVNGGVEKSDSHSWELISQRYAYDLIKREDMNKLEQQCKYRRLSEWSTYGSPVIAALDGIVVATVDGVDDNEPVGRISLKAPTLLGNYIIIRHGDGLYSLYAHLKKDSLRVAEGDTVKAGDAIAEAGNTGMSTAPHLHFQLMTTSDPLATVSTPLKVRGSLLNNLSFTGYLELIICSEPPATT